MTSKLTNKQLQKVLKLYPDDAQVIFVPGAEKRLVWYGLEKPDWAIHIEMINKQVHIFVAEYNKREVE